MADVGGETSRGSASGGRGGRMAGVGETFEHFADEAKKLPWWAWIVLAVVVFVLFQHFFSSSGTTTNAPSADQTALADTVPGVVGDTSTTGGSSGTAATMGSTGTTGAPAGDTVNPGSGVLPVRPVRSPQPAPAPAPAPSKPAPAPAKPPYTVESGDTLSEIASKERVSEPALYSTNAGVIESTARAHGFSSSDNGHWIFPGEQLVIP